MSTMTFESFETYAQPRQQAHKWIRVGMDTGGLAAGAQDVYDALCQARDKSGLDVDIQRTGSLGYAYADPVLIVGSDICPRIVYGAMTPEDAENLIEKLGHENSMLDDRVMAMRKRSLDLKGEDQVVILVKDTSTEGEDRTAFYQQTLQEELAVHGLADKVHVHRALDMRMYNRGLCVQLLPSGVTYADLVSPDLRRIIKTSLVEKKIVEDLLVDVLDPQDRVVLRNCGHIDPDNIESYLFAKGYTGLKRVLSGLSPEEAIEEMKQSGLRGRGGAGFPTWLKWNLTREPAADQKYVICNADEGDPGAFMDRSVLESDPHSVLEGLMIAAYCIGASKGFFYIRAEYPLAVERIQQAIDQAREKGLIGENILGTDFCFDAEVRLGAGAFVCGEETALIASIEGRRGSPEPRPPYPSVKGLWGKPTSINNVETLAAVAAIYENGAEWFASRGTEKSKGTKVFAVTGKVKNSQLVEVPMGTPIRTIIEDICGGALNDVDIKGVQTGGPSGGVIPQKHLDTGVSYEDLQVLGSIMGSGGMLVMDERDSMVDVAKFYLEFCVDESCGKCAPCRIGGYQMLKLLDQIYRGRGVAGNIDDLRRICHCMQNASLCGLGQTAPNPVLSTLRYFEDEYMAYIEGGAAYARKMKKQQAEAAMASN
ncbi:MAG: NADH-ubiquinone oxidoreductase-F iron-sulfur binding region domain-containing protein [Puniceicoccaceae bacterium]